MGARAGATGFGHASGKVLEVAVLGQAVLELAQCHASQDDQRGDDGHHDPAAGRAARRPGRRRQHPDSGEMNAEMDAGRPAPGR
ncbi:hypothetical protein [Streptomyces sp. NPDC056682]|uniref:hypothetical protein n=1 Tax=Streptomyces sp. NPDC056682 TaxID=3345909 RepID=UPI003687F646